MILEPFTDIDWQCFAGADDHPNGTPPRVAYGNRIVVIATGTVMEIHLYPPSSPETEESLEPNIWQAPHSWPLLQDLIANFLDESVVSFPTVLRLLGFKPLGEPQQRIGESRPPSTD